MTKNKQIPIAKSIVDYIFRWLDQKFPEGRYEDQQMLPGFGAPVDISQAQPKLSAQSQGAIAPKALGPGSEPATEGKDAASLEPLPTGQQRLFVTTIDAPPCPECGSLEMIPNGSCYKCMNCGGTSGCS